MGQFREVDAMFRNVNYNRFTSPVIRTAMKAKITAVTAKIAERRGRIARIMEENHITQEVFSDMIIQFMKDQEQGRNRVSYSVSNSPGSNIGRVPPQNTGTTQAEDVFIPAGVISNLITEKSLIETETAEVSRLNLIIRNLKDEDPHFHERTGTTISRTAIHTLTDAEIEYLGF